jgi:hypothetical protein
VVQTGKFDQNDSRYVWGILAGSTIGLLASTLGRLYASTYYALHDTRTPLLYATLRVTIGIALGYVIALHAPGWIGADADGRVREHRLYQADWLIRHYGFDAPELTTDAHPNLSLTLSPKLAWALRHPESFPVDVNVAPREQLLRIPGIGYRTVDKLLRIRRHHRIAIADLVKLRVRMSEARHFVVTADAHPARAATADLFTRAEQPVLQW